MGRLKRLCPACGAANALESETCHACGAEMKASLPVPAGERSPVPWKEVGASLALSAGVLAVRAGLRLAGDLLERRAARRMGLQKRTRLPSKVGRWLTRRGEVEEAPGQQPQVRVWGRRVWGRWRSDGERDLEVEEFFWQASDQ